MNRAGPQIDDEQRVKGDQPIPGQHLRCEKVSRDQGFPMGLEKSALSRVLATDRSGIQSVAMADIVDSRIAHRESEIVQSTNDAVAAPGWILLDQFDDELFKFWIHAWPPDWICPGKGPLLGDKDSKPTEQGVGSDDGDDSSKATPTDKPGFAS